MRIRALAIGVLAAAMLIGCGDSSSDKNEQLIAEAGSQEAASEEVLAALDEELNLAPYAGVDDTFTPEGAACQPLGPDDTERCCSIENVHVGDDVALYGGSEGAVYGPDDSYLVDVGIFVGASEADCYQAVADAVESIGAL